MLSDCCGRSAIFRVPEVKVGYNEQRSQTLSGGDLLRTTEISWTNRSVVALAGKADPVQLIETMARQLVLRARDEGWMGPPYNPLVLADMLKIAVEANGDVSDARTVPTSQGIKIEFNPTKPRERVEFLNRPRDRPHAVP